MKKILYFFALSISVSFVACNKIENVAVNSDEEILAAVKFVGQGALSEQDEAVLRSGPGIGISILRAEFGRKSLQCKGFGICSVTILGWGVYNEIAIENDNENSIFLRYDESVIDMGKIELLLAEQPGIDMRHVTLAVDEEIPIINETGSIVSTIPAQNAVFNSTLSKAGGFQIALQ